MRNEILRMERVTYIEDEIVKLKDFNLQIYQGEIIGLLPVTSHGKSEVLKLLARNLPLYDGYVYYGGEKVNTWKDSHRTANRLSIIQEKSSLAENLNIADNIFVLRPGFKQWVIRSRMLNRQLEPFFKDIGLDIQIDKEVSELSAFERIVVEILRAVVMGYHLIVLDEVGALVSNHELEKLHSIIRHYVDKGFSFLYVCSHLEEIVSICDRCALFSNGRIMKVMGHEEMQHDPPVTYMSEYNDMVRFHAQKREEDNEEKQVLFQWDGYGESHTDGFHFQVYKGECVAMQILDAGTMEEMRQILTGDLLPERGRICLHGKNCRIPGNQGIAVVQERATKSMIFPELDYMNNLCICLAEKVPSIWHDHRLRKSIFSEYAPVLGEEVFYMPVENLSEKQKYQLVYTRILLQKPEILFCIQPFMGADLVHRMYIWSMLEKFLDKGISVVILSLNLSDSLAIADRLLILDKGGRGGELRREEFSGVAPPLPWSHSYPTVRKTSED
nr:ATP-binding cassette domain-containing protein [uncultured Blautia sp.]